MGKKIEIKMIRTIHGEQFKMISISINYLEESLSPLFKSSALEEIFFLSALLGYEESSKNP